MVAISVVAVAAVALSVVAGLTASATDVRYFKRFCFVCEIRYIC